MPKARNRLDRVVQCLRWMEATWPTGRRIELVWVDQIEDDDGNVDKHAVAQTYREGARIVIEMIPVRCPHCLISTIQHEFAHAKLWGHSKVEHKVAHHDVSFFALKGAIEDAWAHDHGAEQANDFPVD